MARESKKLPFAEYRKIVTAETVRYFQYEANASIIRQVHPILVPGLLQIEEYTRALLRRRRHPHRKTSTSLSSRVRNGKSCSSGPTTEAFSILDEAVLRRDSRRRPRRWVARSATSSRCPATRHLIQVLPFRRRCASPIKARSSILNSRQTTIRMSSSSRIRSMTRCSAMTRKLPPNTGSSSGTSKTWPPRRPIFLISCPTLRSGRKRDQGVSRQHRATAYRAGIISCALRRRTGTALW